MQLIRQNQRGDTIVEVLISIAVISLILAGAYVLTNNSLQGTTAAQERLNGTKLVESQLEQLKNLAATSSTAVFDSAPATFCIVGGTSIVATSNAGCHVGADGAATTREPVFNLSISRSGNVFTVKNVWNNIKSGQDNVEMKYRLYEQ